jgi:hypothetical protein
VVPAPSKADPLPPDLAVLGCHEASGCHCGSSGARASPTGPCRPGLAGEAGTWCPARPKQGPFPSLRPPGWQLRARPNWLFRSCVWVAGSWVGPRRRGSLCPVAFPKEKRPREGQTAEGATRGSKPALLGSWPTALFLGRPLGSYRALHYPALFSAVFLSRCTDETLQAFGGAEWAGLGGCWAFPVVQTSGIPGAHLLAT